MSWPPAGDAGRALLALSGTDTTGTFYAAQTLRQLLTGKRLPAVTVRDWPTAKLRGVIEGFYGTPWTHAERLSQLDFYGRTKQNVYVYSPKDDPYLRERWRDEYPAAQLDRLRELVDRAAARPHPLHLRPLARPVGLLLVRRRHHRAGP